MNAVPRRRNAARVLAWPVTLFLLALATPPELSVSAGGLRISAYRAVLLWNILPCLLGLLNGKFGRILLSDWLVIFHSVWAVLALINYAGVGQGLESGGIYFVEALGAYLVGRCCLRETKQFVAMSDLMVKVVATMCGIAFIESVTGQHFVREISRQILRGPPLPYIEPRMGLHRAYASFDHPILYGIFCASSFGLAFYVRPESRVNRIPWVRAGITVVATFFSLSAGAFSALGVQLFLAGWDLMTRGIAQRWAILGGLLGLVMGILTLASNRSPIKVFLTYFTFSPGTGYNRIRIWDYGTAELMRHPILGIGLGDWERPAWMVSGSMDNFWLATAVRYGLPAMIALMGALLWLLWKLGTARFPSKVTASCRSGWITCMVGLSVAGSTVHYWNALFCLFCFLLGSGAWMATPESRRPAPPQAAGR